MALGVELKLQRTNILFQENPNSMLVLSNNSVAPLTIHNLTFDPAGLTVKVVEVSTHSETVHKGSKPPWQKDQYQSLSPGQRLEYEYPLLSLAEFKAPGEYLVSAIVEYSGPDGRQQAESRPVAVKIVPVTSNNLSLTYATGGWSANQYGISVNTAAEPAALVRHTFSSLPEGGGVLDAIAGPAVSAEIKPVVSQPGNGNISHAQWVAWIKTGTLNVTHFDPGQGFLPVKQWPVPGGGQAELVSPLHIAAANDSNGRSPGSALLMSELSEGDLMKLQAVYFSPIGEITTGASLTFEGGRPLWVESHEKSDGDRLVTYVQDVVKGWALFAVPWPDSKPTAPVARKLGEWPGIPLAFGTALTPDDTILGAVVVRNQRGRTISLKLMTWSLSDNGEFAIQPLRDIPWDPRLPVERAFIGISPREAVVAILTGGKGRRFIYDSSGKLQVAPGLLAMGRSPLEVAFVGQTSPVLIAAREGRGFSMVYLNGQSLGHGH